jgi:hypothetical protein
MDGFDLESRLDAVARALGPLSISFPHLSEEAKATAAFAERAYAKAVISAAFPELAERTHWIAPMEPTKEMATAMETLDKGPPTRRWHWVWQVMRDAHLKTD